MHNGAWRLSLKFVLRVILQVALLATLPLTMARAQTTDVQLFSGVLESKFLFAPLTDLSGSSSSTHSISKERAPVVVIVGWASWCGYCKDLLKTLSAEDKSRIPDEVGLLPISFDENADEARVLRKDFLGTRALRSFHDKDGIFREQIRRRSKIPIVLVLNRERRVIATFVGGGERNYRKLLEAIDKAVRSLPGAGTNAASVPPQRSRER